MSEPIAVAEAERLVAGSGAVDAAGLEGRVAALDTRSVKGETKRWALDLMVRCLDLTTLEGSDTDDTIVALCAKAIRPDPLRPEVSSVAAVCLFPRFVPVAVEQLRGSDVAVASVAGDFPNGVGPLDARLHEIREAAAMGADEIDSVLNRSLFLGGRYAEAFDELVAAREAAGAAQLKVILETGVLGSYDRIRQASMLAMSAGADFIKTSTGKVAVNATLPAALCMAEAVRDFRTSTDREVGVKVAGGVRTATQALQYVVMMHETLGIEWMRPERFRIGASGLLHDVLRQLETDRSGG